MLSKKDYINTSGNSSQTELIMKKFRSAMYDAVEKYIKGGKLLDIGCGTKPLAELLKGRVNEHIGFDHEGTFHEKNNIDVFGDIYNMPFADNTFDSSISTAVLEHLEEPQKAVDENFRVLKEGGIAIYSIPLFFHVHEAPRDFYRFTEHGIRYIFEKAGFEILEIKPLSGFWTTFGTFLSYTLQTDPHFKEYQQDRSVTSLIELILAKAEKMDAVYTDSSYTWMYLAIAKKNQQKKSAHNNTKEPTMMKYIYNYDQKLHAHIMELKEQKEKEGYANLIRPVYANEPQARISDDVKAHIIKYALDYFSISYDDYLKEIADFFATRHTLTQYNNQEETDIFWQEISPSWASLNIYAQFQYYNEAYDCVAKRFANKALSVCDYGCGTGALALALTRTLNIEKLTLLDLDNKIADLVKYIIQKEENKNIEFHDILKEHNEQYDLVICLDVLEHLENSYETLQKLDKLVKPNGYMLLKIAFEAEDNTHLPQAAEDFLIKNDGIAYLNEHFIPLQEFPELHQLVYGLYKKKNK